MLYLVYAVPPILHELQHQLLCALVPFLLAQQAGSYSGRYYAVRLRADLSTQSAVPGMRLAVQQTLNSSAALALTVLWLGLCTGFVPVVDFAVLYPDLEHRSALAGD